MVGLGEKDPCFWLNTIKLAGDELRGFEASLPMQHVAFVASSKKAVSNFMQRLTVQVRKKSANFMLRLGRQRVSVTANQVSDRSILVNMQPMCVILLAVSTLRLCSMVESRMMVGREFYQVS